VIENIERLDAELRLEPFPEFKALADRKVDVVESGIAEDIPAHGTKGLKSVGINTELPTM